MGSFKRPRAFDSLDLEIIDRVYEVAWAHLEGRDPYRDRAKDGERGEALRKLLFALVGSGQVDFDTLCDKVLASMPECWALATVPGNARGQKVEGGTPGA